MNYTIIDVFKAFTVFQILLVSVFLLLHRQRKSKKNLLLVLFILSKAFFVGDILLISYHTSIPLFLYGIICLGTGFQLFLGPAAYFIMVVIINNNFSFKRVHLLHCIPFALYIVLVFSQYTIHSSAEQLQMLNNWYPYSAPWGKFVFPGIYLHFTAYGIAALQVLSRGRKTLYAYTSQSVERNIRLLKFLIYDFIVVWGINSAWGYFHFGEVSSYILQCATAFNIFFIANAIVYLGLTFPAIFESETEQRNKYEKNLLTYDEKQAYAKKINEYMEQHKPYLNPLLSLSDLAGQLALPPHIVSQVLNVMMNQNFYDFINSYRVNESKALLSSSQESDQTILSILYQSGFNSKSVFNAAFKKQTGITPRQFKKTVDSLQREKIVSIAS